MGKKILKLILKMSLLLSGTAMLIISGTVKMNESSRTTLISVGSTLVLGTAGLEKTGEIKEIIKERKERKEKNNVSYGKRFN